LRITATLATWDFTIFEVATAGRNIYACIPREYLSAFVEALDAGHLDSFFWAVLRGPAGNRVLQNRRQTAQPGVWDRIGRGSDLLAPERAPSGVIVLQPGETVERSGKSEGVAVAPNRRRFSALFALLLVVLGAASVAMGYLLTREDSTDSAAAVVASPTPSATATATASASPTATVVATPTGTATTVPSATPLPTATVVVVAPTAAPAPTATPIPPTATPVPPNPLAGAGPVSAFFNQQAQATTYTVQNTQAGLTYSWSLSEACGGTAGGDTNAFTWNHPHPPCDATSTHANAIIQVVVTDPATNNRVSCTHQGAQSGSGPPCQPF
jgi:hypothetical protein